MLCYAMLYYTIYYTILYYTILIHSLTDPFIHSFTRSFIHSFSYLFIYLFIYGYVSTKKQPDGDKRIKSKGSAPNSAKAPVFSHSRIHCAILDIQ